MSGSDALQACKPRRLATQHSSGLWQTQSHGSAPIQQAIDLGNGLAHLLLDALTLRPVRACDLRIGEAVDPMGKEDLPRPWFQLVDRMLKPTQGVSRFSTATWSSLLITCDLEALAGTVVAGLPLSPIAQQIRSRSAAGRRPVGRSARACPVPCAAASEMSSFARSRASSRHPVFRVSCRTSDIECWR